MKSILHMTRDGQEIVMCRVPRAQNHKIGLITDEVHAYVNDEMVGYLAFDYTSELVMEAECGNLFSYLHHWTGGYFGESIDGKSLDDFTIDETTEALRGVKSYYLSSHSYDEATFQEALDDRDKAISLLNDFIDRGIFKVAYEKRTDYINFARHPYVAFVNTEGNASRGLLDHSGRGIGKALYIDAAQWIVERNIDHGLYASSLQSDEANRMWNKFSAKGWVKEINGRKYLDGRSDFS